MFQCSNPSCEGVYTTRRALSAHLVVCEGALSLSKAVYKWKHKLKDAKPTCKAKKPCYHIPSPNPVVPGSSQLESDRGEDLPFVDDQVSELQSHLSHFMGLTLDSSISLPHCRCLLLYQTDQAGNFACLHGSGISYPVVPYIWHTCHSQLHSSVLYSLPSRLMTVQGPLFHLLSDRLCPSLPITPCLSPSIPSRTNSASFESMPTNPLISPLKHSKLSLMHLYFLSPPFSMSLLRMDG